MTLAIDVQEKAAQRLPDGHIAEDFHPAPFQLPVEGRPGVPVGHIGEKEAHLHAFRDFLQEDGTHLPAGFVAGETEILDVDAVAGPAEVLQQEFPLARPCGDDFHAVATGHHIAGIQPLQKGGHAMESPLNSLHALTGKEFRRHLRRQFPAETLPHGPVHFFLFPAMVDTRARGHASQNEEHGQQEQYKSVNGHYYCKNTEFLYICKLQSSVDETLP